MFSRPLWAEIDLGAIRNNINEIRKMSGNSRIMAVIKADAYGHGAVETAKVLAEEGIDFFAVAILEEALELRRAGFSQDILILGWTPPEDFDNCLTNKITLCIYDQEEAEILNSRAKELKITGKVHLKIDTGMTRIGFLPTKENLLKIKNLMNLENLFVEGIFSHLSKADEKDKSYSKSQIDIFSRFVKDIETLTKKEIPLKHIANSAAILDIPEAHFNLVRAGIILYGLKPSDEVAFDEKKFIPAMTLKARFSRVEKISPGTKVSYGGVYRTEKEIVLGTIPAGYADGYTRLLTGKGEIVVKGKKAKILGKICMDQCMADISDIPGIKKGDELILMGPGESADDIAKKLGTINYEVVCMISSRVPRMYK